MSTSSRPFPVSLLSLALWCALEIVNGPSAHAGPGVWTPLGPGAGYQSTGCVTIHPKSPGSVWACLPHGGLYKSADRGSTWRWAGQPFSGPWSGADAVAADSFHPDALWGATSSAVYRTEDGGLHWVTLTGTSYVDAISEASPFQVLPVAESLYVAADKRLLVSSDNGSTWSVLYDTGKDGWIETFAANAEKPADLYLAGRGADGAFFLRSSNAGSTWEDLTDRLFPAAEIGRLAATSTALYASVEGRLLRSDDRGFNWRSLLGKKGAPALVVTWTLDPRAPRTLYVFGATTEHDSAEYALWVSHNRGTTWKKLGKPPIFPDHLAVDSGSGALYVAGADGLARSLDGGVTWKVVLRVPDREGSCAQISFQPENPDRLDLAVGGTIWRSANKGRIWSLRGAPSWVTALDVDPEDPYRLVAVAGWDAYLSENGGRTWRRTSTALWYSESLTRVDRHTLIVAGAGLYRSGDNGETWQTVLEPWPPGTDIGRWPQKVEVDPADSAKIYALVFQVDDMELPHGPLVDYPSSLWRSVDSGRTWRKVAQNLRAFAMDRGTSRLYGVRNQSILVSDDGGRTWTTVARTPYLVQDLVIDPTDPGILYIAGEGSRGVWRSTDRGTTWELLGERFVLPEIYSLTLHPADPRTLYAADRWGVWEMTIPEGPR